mmetsp:Transcript_70625/g.184138  ORF Transcript_70625/g.184138 Transcript_70625/m.184138 type:complete len:212 (+) Transcript_70625:261-896(+)
MSRVLEVCETSLQEHYRECVGHDADQQRSPEQRLAAIHDPRYHDAELTEEAQDSDHTQRAHQSEHADYTDRGQAGAPGGKGQRSDLFCDRRPHDQRVEDVPPEALVPPVEERNTFSGDAQCDFQDKHERERPVDPHPHWQVLAHSLLAVVAHVPVCLVADGASIADNEDRDQDFEQDAVRARVGERAEGGTLLAPLGLVRVRQAPEEVAFV